MINRYPSDSKLTHYDFAGGGTPSRCQEEAATERPPCCVSSCPLFLEEKWTQTHRNDRGETPSWVRGNSPPGQKVAETGRPACGDERNTGCHSLLTPARPSQGLFLRHLRLSSHAVIPLYDQPTRVISFTNKPDAESTF